MEGDLPEMWSYNVAKTGVSFHLPSMGVSWAFFFKLMEGDLEAV
jgi:hypothetical protein